MKSWKTAVENAEHYLAVGQNRVWLSAYDGWDGDYPWHLATDVTTGGSHRLDIATSLSFSCEHECGLRLEWSFDLEPAKANGSSEYHIDRAAVVAVLGKIPASCARKLRRILIDDAAAVRKRADEYNAAAGRMYADAALLEALSKEAA